MHNIKIKKASAILVPKPVFVEDKQGTFKFSNNLKIKENVSFSTVIEYLNEQFNLNGKDEKLYFSLNSNFEKEQYKLEINRDEILIEAGGDKGVFAAMQTVRQLLISNEGILPCCIIEDKPKFSWRGFMVDCSRNFVTVKQLKILLDLAALHHLNIFHWHFTDDQAWRFEIPSLPKLTEIGARRQNIHYEIEYISHDFYSVKDVEEIIKYASQRFITVVPEIEIPGHVRALLTAYPEYGCTGGPYEVIAHWGIFDEVLCAGNDKLLPFLKRIIQYTASVFPGPYIHIGGDECPKTEWKKCPICQSKIKELDLKDEDELQSYITTEISKYIIEIGKIPIGWDEVLDGSEKMGLPQELIVQSWQGEKGGIIASDKGHDVIMSPNTSGCYFDYKHLDNEEEPGNIGVTTLKNVCEFSPISPKMNKQQRQNVLGGQGNIWTEKIEFPKYLEYMLYPRLSIMAERLWNPCDFEDFEKRKPYLIERLRKLNIDCYSGPSY